MTEEQRRKLKTLKISYISLYAVFMFVAVFYEVAYGLPIFFLASVLVCVSYYGNKIVKGNITPRMNRDLVILIIIFMGLFLVSVVGLLEVHLNK